MISTVKRNIILQIPKLSRISPKHRELIFNSSWMLSERVLRIISGVFVGIYVARYLGPENYGVLSYAIAIAAFVMCISKVGMDSVLVRELALHPHPTSQLTGTAFRIMLIASFFCILITFIVVWNTNEPMDVKSYLTIVILGALFTPFLVADYLFQSLNKAKYSSICKTLTLTITSITKLALIYTQSPLLYFVFVVTAEHAILAFALLVISKHRGLGISLLRFNATVARNLLKSSWPMVLSALAILIQTRIDQVMIANMLSLEQLGIYSASVRIYEAWLIIPYTITISLLPTLAQTREINKAVYLARITQTLRLLIWSCIIVSIFLSITSEFLINLAFGSSYDSSSTILAIIIWGSIFSTMGSVSSRYLNIERMEKKIAYRTILTSLVNISINLVLIPELGLIGASLATVISLFLGNYVIDLLDQDLRELFKIKNRSIIGNPFTDRKYFQGLKSP